MTTPATSPSKSFFLSLNFKDGKATGLMTGRSGRGSFSYKAEGKDFFELMKKFDKYLPADYSKEFYDDVGPSTDGNVEVASGEGLAGKPPNCT